MRFSIYFDSEGDEATTNPREMVERVLRSIIYYVRTNGENHGCIRDINGNKVGEWDLFIQGSEDNAS